MPGIMKQNRINVRPGDPAFSIGSNLCDYFELGVRSGTDYWLEAQIVGAGEFLFNGRIFIPGISEVGTVIDNFPRGPAPNGWTKRQRPDSKGYELVSGNKTLFGYRVDQTATPSRLCLVTVNLYTANGELVAESLSDEFRLHRHPAMIGRGGIMFA
jgi:hypothetical protein